MIGSMNDAAPLELECLPIFRHVPAAQLAPLRAAAKRVDIAAGDTIFRLGDIPRDFYIVEHGSVDIVLPTMSDDVTLATFESGAFFGELAVFDHQPRTAIARAAVDTRLICIPLDDVGELLETHPVAAKQFMSSCASAT